MHIIEVGIIVNGISVIYKSYPENDVDSKLYDNTDLRNSLLDAIVKMSKHVLAEEIHSFNFKKYRLVILTKNIPSKDRDKNYGGAELITYAIGDSKSKTEIIEEILNEILTRFTVEFPNLGDIVYADISKYKRFNPIFDEILADLKLTPEQRFQNLF